MDMSNAPGMGKSDVVKDMLGKAGFRVHWWQFWRPPVSVQVLGSTNASPVDLGGFLSPPKATAESVAAMGNIVAFPPTQSEGDDRIKSHEVTDMITAAGVCVHIWREGIGAGAYPVMSVENVLDDKITDISLSVDEARELHVWLGKFLDDNDIA